MVTSPEINVTSMACHYKIENNKLIEYAFVRGKSAILNFFADEESRDTQNVNDIIYKRPSYRTCTKACPST